MRISVVIPTLNEEKAIGATLEGLFHSHEPEEVIVVDGGSDDETVKIAGEWTGVIRSEKGRARQMNVGARQVKGDVLLFLHADTRLPPSGLEQIRRQVLNGARAGRFRMKFDDGRLLLRLYASYTRFHFFSYGDQGFFVCREIFEKLGGFREDVPFEDIDFYKRLRQVTKPVILRDPVITSARRFKRVGYLRQKWTNLFLAALYYAGREVRPLKEKLYPDIR